ncbi:MAG: helix-turn-helix domain-containing protein [Lentisphaeria bacterium]|nr:helix-turn-helix domain-containing protein [Lentisphaeria bacterium]
MSTAQTSKIGVRLRELREQAGLSLREVCEHADVVPSYLSSLERDLSSPTLAKLRKILVALGTDLETFFSDSPQPAVKSKYAFKRKRMRTAHDPARRYTFLLPRRKGIPVEMLDEYLLPHQPPPEFEVLDSSVSGTVLAGLLVLEIQDEPTELIRPGDAFHVPAGVAHRGRCASPEPVRLITIFSPPKY